MKHVNATEAAIRQARIARLPRWAQVEIESLAQRVEALEATIAESVDPEKTDTFVTRHAGPSRIRQPLPRRTRVVFGDPLGDFIEARIDPPGTPTISSYPSSLVLMASDTIAVEPHASNVVLVYLARPHGDELKGPNR